VGILHYLLTIWNDTSPNLRGTDGLGLAGQSWLGSSAKTVRLSEGSRKTFAIKFTPP